MVSLLWVDGLDRELSTPGETEGKVVGAEWTELSELESAGERIAALLLPVKTVRLNVHSKGEGGQVLKNHTGLQFNLLGVAAKCRGEKKWIFIEVQLGG